MKEKVASGFLWDLACIYVLWKDFWGTAAWLLRRGKTAFGRFSTDDSGMLSCFRRRGFSATGELRGDIAGCKDQLLAEVTQTRSWDLFRRTANGNGGDNQA